MKVMLGDRYIGNPRILEEFGFRQVVFNKIVYSNVGIEYDMQDGKFKVYDIYGAVKLHYLLNQGIAKIVMFSK